MSQHQPTVRVVPPDFADRARKPRSCFPYFAGGVGCLFVIGCCMGGIGLLTMLKVWNDVMPSGPGFVANDAAVKQSSTTINSAGVPVALDLFEPATPGKYPVVLVVHGIDALQADPWKRYYTGQCQELARNGYVALPVHYFERTGTKAGDLDAAKKHVQTWAFTLLDAMAYANQLPSSNGDKVGIVGTSLGAVIGVSLAVLDERVGAVVQISGVLPDEVLDKVKNLPPMLILHGGADQYISQTRVTAMQEKLEAKKVPIESHFYPQQRHVFKGDDAADALQRTVTFLRKHLK